MSALERGVEATARAHLASSDYRIRALSLKLVAHSSQSQDVVAENIKDPDARVRMAALESLLTLHKRGVLLKSSLYEIALATLADEVEEVRFEAIMLIL